MSCVLYNECLWLTLSVLSSEQVLASLNTELLPQIQHTEQAIMDAESASCQIGMCDVR